MILGRMAAGEVVGRPISNPSHEFYIILEGTADVRTAEEHPVHLAPGDFFGALAALDATSPARLLVLPGARFDILVRDVRERLPRL
jgi:CRP-like cAMP-binding protein